MSSKHTSLKIANTLGLDIRTKTRIVAETPDAILNAWQESQQKAYCPFLILGEGSNVLFMEDFDGTVVLNRIKGLEVRDQNEYWKLHVGAGEKWHQMVIKTLEYGIAGLENFALIPGMVGSAPIQNIGAYGLEFKDVCEYVDVLNLNDGQTGRFSVEACHFGYRDSIFKHRCQVGYVITAVGFSLRKKWQPVLTYSDLCVLDPNTSTAWDVFYTVCKMRQSKLPDPKITGNVGSFFKNPVVSQQLANVLQAKYPNMPCYPQTEGSVKLAAGWLIDQCKLKGFRIGNAAVHRHQALVLINVGKATPQDIVMLAKTVRNRVGEKFDIWLEPEVRFIQARGECDALEVIA